MSGAHDPSADPIEALVAGGKPAIARALAALERSADTPETLALLDAAYARAAAGGAGVVIGLTGPPGVGKSSLIDALIRAQRARGRSIAVIAVDPSSRRSGGALLGDRTRLATDPTDAGVFVRSMAARDRLGGLAALVYPAATLLRAAYDLVVIETVGVGQSETDAADIADATVFCAQPASGDALQFMKAGVMETPDLVLVTKADLGAPARRAAADAAGALSLAATDRPQPPVLLVSAATGDGVAEALEAIDALATERTETSDDRARTQALAYLRQAILSEFGDRGWRALRAQFDGSGALTEPFRKFSILATQLRIAFGAVLAELDARRFED
ncbi:MAG: GTP-binding protein [Pseudomonadota bacterium]